MRPNVDPSIARNLFREMKDAEYLEWTRSSKPDKECLRHSYCNRYVIFNAYSAMNYLISVISGRKINVEFEKELVDTVAIDDLSQLLTLEDTTYENLLAGLAELGKEITQDTQYNLYQDKDSIRYLLKACLALNKRQLDSLRQCSIQEFGIRRRINAEFLARMQLHPLWDRLLDLAYSAGKNSRGLDRQLWLDIASLLHVLENDSEIEYIKSKMADWTYRDALLYSQKWTVRIYLCIVLILIFLMCPKVKSLLLLSAILLILDVSMIIFCPYILSLGLVRMKNKYTAVVYVICLIFYFRNAKRKLSL